MKFSILVHKTPLHIAIEKENIELVKILLSHRSIDASKPCISFYKKI